MSVYRLTQAGALSYFTLTHDTMVGKAIQIYGEWTYAEVLLLGSLKVPPGIIVEVGSNIGSHAVPLAKLHPQHRLVAIEPNIEYFKLLCANLVVNAVTNVLPVHAAAGRAEGTLRIAPLALDKPANFGGVGLDSIAHEAGQPVRVARLDDLVEDHDAVRILKVDVEGHECDILAGAAGILARSRPFLYVENEPTPRYREVIAAAQDAGYRLYWHSAAAFRPGNPGGTTVDVFPGKGSINMLGIPAEVSLEPRGLMPVDRTAEHPVIAQRRAREAAAGR